MSTIQIEKVGESRRFFSWLRAWLFLTGFILYPAALQADNYYMMIYSAQGDNGLTLWSHNFAVFARVLPTRQNTQANPVLESVTISWLPAHLPICASCVEPVAGRNYPLFETMSREHAIGQRLSQWGPYEIKGQLYAMAKAQVKLLNSGNVRYTVWDKGYRPHASNCIHAISDIDKTQSTFHTVTRFGDTASEALAHFFAPYVIARRRVPLARWLSVADIPVFERTP